MAPGLDELLDRAIATLLDPALEPIVEMVLRRESEEYVASAADGESRFRRDGNGGFVVGRVRGRDPLGDQATDRFAPLSAELAGRCPNRSENAYPYAHEQVAQLFDSPDAPDLCVVHTAAHNWEDQGGHRGEHGSLDAVQARAPFVLAGAGVRHLGKVPRACRLVDVAPTVAALLGVAPVEGGIGPDGQGRADALLRRQDGDPLLDLLDGPRPAHVVGLLLDGCNPNVLYDMAARGEAPNVARLMAEGTTFEHGAVAGLPTVTLANHTAALTGCWPGHHGILHNAWWDRAEERQVITNSPETWATAGTYLLPTVETLHHAVRRTWPDAVTISVNEPCDVGATFSTFDVLRAGERLERPPAAEDLPFATERFVRPVKEYAWSSRVDHTSVQQFEGIWGGRYRGVDYPLPAFTWVNFTLTDAAFHEGGPHSEIAAASVRDTDARIGRVLAAVERAGVIERTAFLLVADHGMEETDPSVTGDWGPALREAGVPYRDEAFGFIYLRP